MKSLPFFMLMITATGALAVSDAPDVQRGRMLYENHCVTCHTPNIHSRAKRLPLTRDELVGIVDHFRRIQNLGWTPAEIDDVVEYLNRTRYRFVQ
jgi:mono/diheme cytochrome c family protein